jgi:hypothetical protein
MISVGAAEFEDSHWVRADQESIFFDQNDIRFEAGVIRGIDLILGTAITILIKVQQSIVETHPNIAIQGVHAEGGEDRMKRWRLAAFILPINFTAGSPSFRPRPESVELEINATVAKAVVLANTRFGKICVAVINAGPGVGSEAPLAKVTIQLRARGKVLSIAELAHEAAGGIVYGNEMGSVESRDSQFAIRKREDRDRCVYRDEAKNFSVGSKLVDQVVAAVSNIHIAL